MDAVALASSCAVPAIVATGTDKHTSPTRDRASSHTDLHCPSRDKLAVAPYQATPVMPLITHNRAAAFNVLEPTPDMTEDVSRFDWTPKARKRGEGEQGRRSKTERHVCFSFRRAPSHLSTRRARATTLAREDP
jgi:hypothetical protein